MLLEILIKTTQCMGNRVEDKVILVAGKGLKSVPTNLIRKLATLRTTRVKAPTRLTIRIDRRHVKSGRKLKMRIKSPTISMKT